MNMQSILDGEHRTWAITNHIPSMHVLFQRGYRRWNKNLTPENYPPPHTGFTKTVSKSGITYQRILHFSKPNLRFNDFSNIYQYGELYRTDTATLHDGLEFVARQFPYLHSGEIVIAFAGQLRKDGSESHVPLLIISPKEVAWDEAPTRVGWEKHWWRASVHK